MNATSEKTLSLSIYISQWAIWVDCYPPICPKRGYGWTLIRLYCPAGHMDGLNPAISPSSRYGWTIIDLYAKLGDIGG